MSPNILMPIMIFMTRYFNNFQDTCRLVSVSRPIFKIFHLTLIALLVIITGSCEKGILKIGADLLPKSDFVFIQSLDTLSAWSYTMYDDSARTDNPALSFLGQIYDPYFGTTTAEFVTQIRMGGKWDDQPFTVDSLKMYLRFLGVRGSTDATHTLRLSEISEQIYTDSAYYSNRTVPLTGYELSDIQLPATLKNDTINNVVIKLPVEFGNYLTRDTSKLFYSNTKPDFRSFFKGLYFRINSGTDPLFITMSLAPPSKLGDYYNYLILFMHDDTGTAKQFFFIIDAQNRNAAFNKYSHDYNTAVPGKKIQHINDGYKDTLTYLQYLNGVYTKVVLPGLENLKNDPSLGEIAVNKARLIVPIFFDGDQFKPSTVPPDLILRYKTASGAKYIVPDYSIESTYHTFFDGKIDSTANVYRFNIPAFVQAYLEDATDNVKPELEIFQGIGARNVILKANKNKTPVKFEFTYTKF